MTVKLPGLVLGLLLLAGCMVAPSSVLCVVTFGDSNVSAGWLDTTLVARSYIDFGATRLAPDAPHHPAQLAGQLERLSRSIRAVNHGISGTTTGDGINGTADRPNARFESAGVSRFAAEVLREGYPWDGGTEFLRVNACPADVVVVAMGTNDVGSGIAPSDTARNLEWMITQWRRSGRDPARFYLCTLPPAPTNTGHVQATNALVREVAHRTGVRLVDVARFVSGDDGGTWRDPSYHVGDGVHYRTLVRAWIAQQVAWSL